MEPRSRSKLIVGSAVTAAIVLAALSFMLRDPAEVPAVEAPSGDASVAPSIGIPGSRPTAKLPVRRWDVLNPDVTAQAVLIQSLDDQFSFLNYGTYRMWPVASLTKLLTAVVALETFGESKRVPVSETAVATEGEAGGLRSGEVYSSSDLVKIMLMASSNDAAAAFEEYGGGKEEFVKLLNTKAVEIGMQQTNFADASGLSPEDQSSANDLLTLTTYIIEKHPEIFSWTRAQSLLAQPTNDATSHIVNNINPLSADSTFLGGKTGTTPAARENLIAVLSFENRRIAVIILGSTDRFKELTNLLSWVRKAYELQ